MSASDKKRIRKEQTAAVLSDKQRQQQAEAKKLKIYTISFVSVMIAIVVIALAVLGARAINNSGVIQKNTIAVAIGDRELNSVELSYYYHDAINDFYNQWYEQYNTYADSYLQAMGLDTKAPLNEQVYDQESGQTWDQYFIEQAVENAKSDFALFDLANKEEFSMPEEEQTTLDNMFNNLETYATIYGFKNANQYLRAMYGFGADVESFKQYSQRNTLAAAYKQAHEDSLTYEDADILAYATEKPNDFNSYDYASAYLSYTDFRQGGTEDEDGHVTYTEEQNQAAREAMKVAAEQLAGLATLDEIKSQIGSVEVNDSSELAVNDYQRVLHTTLNTALADWLAEEGRQSGDIAAIANTSTTTDENGNETTVVNGYYVTCFLKKYDNSELMSNVRHLLVKFEGGSEDEQTGDIVYSDEEMGKAKSEAEGYLKTWLEGDADEDSFIELVKEHSGDSSAEEGGLFEDIHPDSQYAPNFLNWAIDPERKAGDAEVIDTEFGYHVMYYVGDDEMSYRDYMITNEMRANDQQEWYEGVLKTVTAVVKDTSKMDLDLVLAAG